jgi:serine/threonine protein kinase
MFEQESALLWLFKEKKYIVKVLGYSVAPLGLLLKHYPKGTLEEWLKLPDARKTKRLIFRFLANVSAGLNLLHNNELCHSNLTAKTIYIDEEEDGALIAVIKDFEICQILSHKIFPGRRFHSTHILGDYLRYAAPETISRYRAKKVNLGSMEEFLAGDIFSVGMLAYQMLHKVAPWENNSHPLVEQLAAELQFVKPSTSQQFQAAPAIGTEDITSNI